MEDHGIVPALEPAPRPAVLPDAPAPPLGGRLGKAGDPLGRPELDLDLLLEQESWVRAVARHLVRDAARAEDVAQETLLAAIQSPPRDAQDPRRLRAWLGRVAHNLAHLETRRRMRRRAREERVAQGEAQTSAADLVARGSVLSEVESAVAELEEPYQSAVRARYFEGKSTAEIALASATTDNAIRKRLWRAREKLRQNLDRRHNGERLAWFNALAPLVLPGALPPIDGGAGVGSGVTSAAGGTTGAGVTAAGTAGSIGIGSIGLWATAAGLALWGGIAAQQWSQQTDVDGREMAANERELAHLGLRTPVATPDVEATTVVGTSSTLGAAGLQSPRAAGERKPVREGKDDGSAPEPIEPEALPVSVELAGVVLHAQDGLPIAETPIGTRIDGELVELARTDSLGRFRVESKGPEGLAALELLDARWTTLRRGHSVAPSESEADPAGAAREALFVVADAVDVEGRVLDPNGQPVAGAEVTLVLSDDLYLRLEHALDGTEPVDGAVDRSTITDEDGSFRLERLPSADGASLHVTDSAGSLALGAVANGGLETAVLAVPRGPRHDLVVRLEAPPAPPLQLSGTVLFADARPAPRATVRFGSQQALTDARGRFELSVAEVRAGDELRAWKAGWVEARVSDLGERLVEQRTRVDGRAEVQLTLTARQRSIAGNLGGLPAGGWILASAGLEGQDANGLDRRTSKRSLRGNGDGGSDHEGSLNDNSNDGGLGTGAGGASDSTRGDDGVGPPPPAPPGDSDDRPLPPAPPGSAGPDGSFDLPGGPEPDADSRGNGASADPRRWVRGFDPTTGRVLEVGPVQPGQPGAFDGSPLDPALDVPGVLLDPEGAPVDGAQLRLVVRLGADPGPDGWVPRLWRDDAVVSTRPDGTFRMPRVPARFAAVEVEHPDLGRRVLSLPELGPPAAEGPSPRIELVSPRLASFRVDARSTEGADGFRLLDASGHVLPLVGADTQRTRGRLHAGQSPVLRAPLDARTLVLVDREGAELLRLDVRLQSMRTVLLTD